tara:strand:- start:1364 stop:1813 length:450 start_codon:yes stop_codon:yes gene_type:complete
MVSQIVKQVIRSLLVISSNNIRQTKSGPFSIVKKISLRIFSNSNDHFFCYTLLPRRGIDNTLSQITFIVQGYPMPYQFCKTNRDAVTFGHDMVVIKLRKIRVEFGRMGEYLHPFGTTYCPIYSAHQFSDSRSYLVNWHFTNSMLHSDLR